MHTVVVYADSLDEVLFRINDKIINPIIDLGFVIALTIFLWGLFQFIRAAQSSDKRKIGQQHMLWGVVGLFIMFSVFGIINLLISTFGIKGATINKDEQKFDPPPIQEVQLPK